MRIRILSFFISGGREVLPGEVLWPVLLLLHFHQVDEEEPWGGGGGYYLVRSSGQSFSCSTSTRWKRRNPVEEEGGLPGEVIWPVLLLLHLHQVEEEEP
jgi:hypothetical protein